MAELFQPQELADYLQKPLTDLGPASVLAARRIAGGWLLAATGLTAFPDPVPDDLWTWAIELAAIALDNPTGRASEASGGVSTGFGRRRAEILTAAAARYPPASGTAAAPQFSFPPPPPWPVA